MAIGSDRPARPAGDRARDAAAHPRRRLPPPHRRPARRGRLTEKGSRCPPSPPNSTGPPHPAAPQPRSAPLATLAAPPLPAHRPDTARAGRAAADAGAVRARDRAGPEAGAAHRAGLRGVRRDRHDRPADPAEHDVRGDRRARRPRDRRAARAAHRADLAGAALARQPGRRVRDDRAAGRCPARVAPSLRGIELPHRPAPASLWFLVAAALFTVGMYGVAETLAARVPRPRSTSLACRRSRSCRGSSPARCSRSRRCPSGSTWFTRFLPLTHALALVRYGLLGDPSGLAHLADEQRRRDGRAQPRGRRPVRRGGAGRRDPRVPAQRRAVTPSI